MSTLQLREALFREQSKQMLMKEMEHSFEELRQIKDGKLEAKDAEELLDEL